MSDTHEIYKPIEESRGKYSVSNMGRVRNNETGIVLKPIKFTKGYVKVNLHLENGQRYSRSIHRLVAMAFIPNPENKPEVNHKNGIHDDNKVSNLEWMTGEENKRHAYDTGLVRHKDDRYSGYLYNVWVDHHKDEMCSEWQDYMELYRWSCDNGYKSGLKLCRKDTDLKYSPENCYFSETKQHPRMKKANRKHAYICFGELLTIEELSEKYNISDMTIIYRMNKGMSVEEAVTKPLVKSGRPRKVAI